jgi:hypothetical protein
VKKEAHAKAAKARYRANARQRHATNYWKEMGVGELEGQLTPMEFAYYTTPNDVRNHEIGVTFGSKYGNGLNNYCVLGRNAMDPIAVRKRWTGWKGNSMVHVLHAMVNHGHSNLLVAGDSIAGQLFLALKCSAIRYGCTLTNPGKVQDAVSIKCPQTTRAIGVYLRVLEEGNVAASLTKFAKLTNADVIAVN